VWEGATGRADIRERNERAGMDVDEVLAGLNLDPPFRRGSPPGFGLDEPDGGSGVSDMVFTDVGAW
jgi:hypothetical protein